MKLPREIISEPIAVTGMGHTKAVATIEAQSFGILSKKHFERKGPEEVPLWGVGSSASHERHLKELDTERRVSEYIRGLEFLWVDVDDEPGTGSDRAYIERNALALISNYDTETMDPHSDDWLGNYSPSRKIRQSGLWNVNHVDESTDLRFLDGLELAVDETTQP